MQCSCSFLVQKVVDVHDGQKAENQSTFIAKFYKPEDISSGHDILEVPSLASLVPESDSSGGTLKHNIDFYTSSF